MTGRSHQRQELDDYMAHFTLQGGGGTDFRPAFAYVDQLSGRGVSLSEPERNDCILQTDTAHYPARNVRRTMMAFMYVMEEDYTDATGAAVGDPSCD